MICKKFSDLTAAERVMFIGELTHACMNDDDLYEKGVGLINVAIARGIFDNVIIMPTEPIENDIKI